MIDSSPNSPGSNLRARLTKNFLSLSSIQLVNTLIPLLAYPYLIRIIGIEKFGLVALAQASVNLFVLIVDYGHNISATKQVALAKSDPIRLSKTVWEVLSVRLVLGLLSLATFFLAVELIPQFQSERELFWHSSVVILAQIILSNWFFQGIEKMHHLHWLNLGSRLFFVLGSLVFITQAEDYILINLMIGIGNLAAGGIGLAIVFFLYRLPFSPRILGVKKQLIAGWPIFLSNLSGYGSLNINLLVLGFFAPADILGFYSLAERVYLAVRSLPVTIYHTVFPTVCQLASGPFQKFLEFNSNLLKIILLLMVPVVLILFGLADWVIWLIAGVDVPQAAFLLKIIAMGPLIAALNIPPSQTLLAFNFELGYLRVVVIGAVFNIGLNLLLVPWLLGLGSAISLILTETFLTMYLYYYLHRYHRSISVNKIFLF